MIVPEILKTITSGATCEDKVALMVFRENHYGGRRHGDRRHMSVMASQVVSNSIVLLTVCFGWYHINENINPASLSFSGGIHRSAENICMSWRNQDRKTRVHMGPGAILRCHLISIGHPIVEIRRPYDHLIPTLGCPVLVRWHLYIESGHSTSQEIWTLFIFVMFLWSCSSTHMSLKISSHESVWVWARPMRESVT